MIRRTRPTWNAYYNDYEKFGVLFDRSVKWEDKEKIAGQSSVRQREPKRRQD